MKIRDGKQIVWLTVAVASGFWVLGAVFDLLVAGDERSFSGILFSWHGETTFRLVAVFVLLAYGGFMARLFDRQRHIEKKLQEEIRERRWAEEALLESEEKYRSLVESTEDSIYVVDRDTRYIYMNKKHLARLGKDLREVLGHRYAEFHTDEETAGFCRHVTTVFESGESLQREHRSFRDGNWFLQTLSPVRNAAGEVKAVTVVSKLITERKMMENRLRVMSFTDELTGLYNRRGFFATAEQQLKLAARTNRRLYMLYADLDNLKEINDEHGHHEGDEALSEVARVMKETLRDSDIVARIGGDEFVALPVGHTASGARTVLDRLREKIERLNRNSGRPYRISISMGMPCFDPENPVDVDRLLAMGDELMYREKRAKKKARAGARG